MLFFKCKVFLKKRRTHCCQTSQCVKHVDAVKRVSVKPVFSYFSWDIHSGSYRRSGTWAYQTFRREHQQPSSETRHFFFGEVAWWISQRRRRNKLGSGTSLFTIRCSLFWGAALQLQVRSWESEVETQSSVRVLIFSPTRQHHQYNCMSDLSLSSEQGGWVLRRKLSPANLPVWDTGS